MSAGLALDTVVLKNWVFPVALEYKEEKRVLRLSWKVVLVVKVSLVVQFSRRKIGTYDDDAWVRIV